MAENQKDRFGETLKLVERAREDIYFAERDRQLIDKLRASLRKVEAAKALSACPKCPGRLESYAFMEFLLDRCDRCGGIWLDRGELEAILRKVSRGPLASWVDRLLSHHEESEEEPTQESLPEKPRA